MKLLRQRPNIILKVTLNVSVVIWCLTHVGFKCGWSHPSEQTPKEKPSKIALASKEQADWLKELWLERSGVNTKFFPDTPQSFLKITWPLEDDKETASPTSKKEHSANFPSTAHALEECVPWERSEASGSRPGTVSDRSQTWKKPFGSRVWLLQCKRPFWYLKDRVSPHGECLWLPTGGIFLVYHQDLEQKQEWFHILQCPQKPLIPVHFAYSCIAQNWKFEVCYVTQAEKGNSSGDRNEQC